MKTRTMTQARLKELLDYDPKEGVFRWRAPQTNRVKVGDEAGSVASNGRLYIQLDGSQHIAHRLAWLYVYGVWSDKPISAKDGDYLNLKIGNYEEATYAEIARSGRTRSSGSSGIKGVSWDKSKNKWQATITRDYKQIHLGRFDTKEEAAEAYRKAAEDNGKIIVPDDERQSKAQHLAIVAKQRIVWRKTQHLACNVTGWASFKEFAKDIGTCPPEGHDVVAADPSKPVGPGNFTWRPHVAAQFDHSTREGRVAYGKAYREANPDLFKHKHLLSSFGITLERYREMHDTQNGVCAICEKPETVVRKGKLLPLAVDHCHDSNEVRGLLCVKCNQAIGQMEDDIDRLYRAIEYIKRHRLIRAGQSAPDQMECTPLSNRTRTD